MNSKEELAVIEVSYEIGNKIGGIHTVLSSKAQKMRENLKEYLAIGPYYEKKAQVEFEEKKPDAKLQKIFTETERESGVKCYYGQWIAAGHTECILVDFSSLKGQANQIKKELWDSFKIDSYVSDDWFNEPIVWGRATGILIEKIIKHDYSNETKVIVHLHEWLSGAALLYLKEKKVKAKTVFTTHATVLGRTIAETKREDLYELIEEGFKEKKPAGNELAYNYGVQAKHLTEKACALNANVFSAVSEAVSKEAEFILGKKPDAILPNGLDMEQFPIMEDLSILHRQYRNRIRAFVEAYFSPYYNIEVENSLFYFIAGRYEFHNKGIDLFIDALGELNKKLKEEKTEKTIVAFVWIAADINSRNQTVMENLALYQMIEDALEQETPKVQRQIFEAIVQGKDLNKSALFEEEFLDNIKKIVLRFRSHRGQMPPICAFNVDERDDIIQSIKRNELLNREEDRVKVIFYPTYLSPADGLIGLNYYPAIIGSHLGVFPSYYEPWGYTPLETAALAVPSVTTDLAGFGQFIEETQKKKIKGAIEVLHRRGKTRKEETMELVHLMHSIFKMSKQERMDRKIAAKELASLADWSKLIHNYLHAYELALSK
ncbi:MAG: glycogen/starch synthase [Candidatus Diapherotrites archaeon]